MDYRVEKMRLSRDKSKLKYNDFLTLAGIPPESMKSERILAIDESSARHRAKRPGQSDF